MAFGSLDHRELSPSQTVQNCDARFLNNTSLQNHGSKHFISAHIDRLLQVSARPPFVIADISKERLQVANDLDTNTTVQLSASKTVSDFSTNLACSFLHWDVETRVCWMHNMRCDKTTWRNLLKCRQTKPFSIKINSPNPLWTQEAGKFKGPFTPELELKAQQGYRSLIFLDLTSFHPTLKLWRASPTLKLSVIFDMDCGHLMG